MSQNIQTIISDEDMTKIDRLVEYGIFPSRDDAINTSIKILIKQEVIKKDDLIRGMAAVNGFLMDHIGDLPFADNPIVEYHKGKKIYKFPIKTRIDWSKTILLGFVSVDSESFSIIPEISDSAEKLKRICEKIAKELHVESTLS